MKQQYIISFAPEWCDGQLKFDVDAESEEEAIKELLFMISVTKTKDDLDISAIDVWDIDWDDDDRHLGCPSYPNCDIDPNGCRVRRGDEVEWYGHRD